MQTSKRHYVNPNRLFIGGIDPNTKADKLLDYLFNFGDIISLKIKTNKKTGLSKGFGFVQCGNSRTRNALLSIDHFFEGRRIDIKTAVPKNVSPENKLEIYKTKLCIPKLESWVTRGKFNFLF